jgi:hypothetical protein
MTNVQLHSGLLGSTLTLANGKRWDRLGKLGSLAWVEDASMDLASDNAPSEACW